MFPSEDTPQKTPNCFDQQIEFHVASELAELAVQTSPVGLVITRFPVPEEANAQNKRNSGDQQMQVQVLSSPGVLRTVHL
jgi:hypothetical protein